MVFPSSSAAQRPPLPADALVGSSSSSNNNNKTNNSKKNKQKNRGRPFYSRSTSSDNTVNSLNSIYSQKSNMSSKTNAKTASQSNLSINEDMYANKVIYDSSNHWNVLTQMHGSVWPKVLLYCIANILNATLVIYLRTNPNYDIDLSFSDRGHTFMSMMVSFLMVTRSNIAYARYMEARQDLSSLAFSCRELISHATTFTRYDKSNSAIQWRLDLARRTIKLLRTVVCVLEFNTYQNHAWKVPILSVDEKVALQSAVGKSNERSPHVLAMFVRSTIAAHVKYLDKPLHVNKELVLYHCVSDFGKAYAGLMKLVSTPFPFPLVQMTRTFLFIWIYTLPWVLVNDFVHKFPALIFTVFFITYAFVGLEFVAIELDDPFGNDDNDFDVLGLATVAFKDIFIIIFDLDGKPSYDNLKALVDESNDSHREAHGHGNDFNDYEYCASGKYQGNCTSTGGNRSSSNANRNTTRNSNSTHGNVGTGSPLRSSQTTATTQINKNNKSKPAQHKRLDSVTAWQIAKITRVEAGSETSMLLSNVTKKIPDELESNVGTGTTRTTVPLHNLNDTSQAFELDHDEIDNWHRNEEKAAVGNPLTSYSSSLYGSIMGSNSNNDNGNNNTNNKNNRNKSPPPPPETQPKKNHPLYS